MIFKSSKFIFLLCFVGLLTSGCSDNRYKLSTDKAPDNAPDVSQVEDAQPRYEAPSRQGNKTYTVRGKTYHVLSSAKGYSAMGPASWYGKKFHGHLTSNGETYDMYSMSAAHKTLPLPSYVRVTNLSNQKQVVVRVNDRGPFHGGRLIDLSYAAAAKLDMLKSGTANVKIEAINVPSASQSTSDAQLNSGPREVVSVGARPTVLPASMTPNTAVPQPVMPNNVLPKPVMSNKDVTVNKIKPREPILELMYIQLVASSNKSKLMSLATNLENKYQLGSRIVNQASLYKLQLGPVDGRQQTEALLGLIRKQGYPKSFIVPSKKQ